MKIKVLSHSDSLLTCHRCTDSCNDSLHTRTAKCARSTYSTSTGRGTHLRERATCSCIPRFLLTRSAPECSPSVQFTLRPSGRESLVRSQDDVVEEEFVKTEETADSIGSSLKSETTPVSVRTPTVTPLELKSQMKEEFRRLPQSPANPSQFPELFSAEIIDRRRNRYIDILPFKVTRVRLSQEPDFYYNANYVLEGQGIAAQGPLPGEHLEFWKMVWYSGTPTLVMLVNLLESGKEKCSCYWPMREPLCFEAENFTITLSAEVRHNHLVTRTFSLEKAGEKRIVTQYHLTHWPDHGVIDKQELAAFVLEIDRLRTENPTLPILAHCSAGVGRTGTFFAVLEGYRRLKQGKPSPSLVFDIVTQLRKERTSMVQTPEQYVLVHETLDLLKATL